MKRFFVIFLAFCLTVSVGCSSSGAREYTNEAGDSIWESDRGLIIRPAAFPVKIPYNDVSVTVEEISLYLEQYNHGYDLYALVVLDLSGLDSDTQYWLKEEDLRFLFSCSIDLNGCSASIMAQLGSVFEDDTAKYITLFRMPRRAYRYDFSDALVAGMVSIRQQVKYTTRIDGRTVSLNKSNELMWSQKDPVDLPSLDQMDDTYYSYVKRWI